MYYKNDDYTARIEIVDGNNRYFIKFHGQVDNQEYEVHYDVFFLYVKEFNKPLERQKNEKKRHIENVDIDDFMTSGKQTIIGDICDTQFTIQTAVKTCTKIQQRRFILRYIHGYSFIEISKMENCDEAAVRHSVAAALKKIKFFLRDSPKLAEF